MAFMSETVSAEATMQAVEPEARVLIIMTGGTICMQKSENGLVPARGFLDACMKSRQEFNDGLPQSDIGVMTEDSVTAEEMYKSLRTPKSAYGKRIR